MVKTITVEQRDEAAAIFKALSDPARLQTLLILADDKTGTVSARLQVLLNARLVTRRREGHTVIYAIADDHVLNLVTNAIEHACEH
jgi:ArsR family transcriptional regulator